MTEPFWRLRIALILWAFLFVAHPWPMRAAEPIPVVVAPSFQPMHVERNWWVSGPGGRYGLLELTTNSVWSEPAAKVRRTTVLLGPWHFTVDLSAPQVLTILVVVALATLFVVGWIRSQRYGR